ncbi:MAG: hypothetical protein ISR87_05540 [Candidatus Marinimicrobia bacterium]|nr:hypothetical protein [FCB group bacterium]MBL7024900.1 hypothetical protein [Candidatus Neomarinimicrobiota bacterium]
MTTSQGKMSELIQELRNRRVFRVAAVYLGVGYAILESSSIIIPMLGFSETIVKIILAILVFGLPISLGLAWMFQMTPDGLRRSPKEGEKQTSGEKPLTSNVAIVVLLVIIAGLLSYQSFSPGRLGSSNEESGGVLDSKSIAVLPFTPFTKTEDDQSFADGMHDDILTQLSKVADLKVISRTSVMQYKETTMLISDIARELGVAHILEGSVRRAGDQIRIVAQLINAETDEHLWAETYDRGYADIFAVQSDVAKKIASALKARLTPREASYIESRYTDDPEAWEWYLKAKLLYDAEIADKDSVITQLERAIAQDSNFLLPYVLLTRLQSWFYFDGTGTDPSPERFEKAKQALAKAESLHSDAPETHMARGYFQYYGFRNYQAAMEEMSLALEMQPNNTELLAGIAYIKRRLGLWEESTRFMEKAVSLDPNNAQKVSETRDIFAMQRDWGSSLKYQERLEAITSWQGSEVATGRYYLELWQSGGDIQHARAVLDDIVARSGKELNRSKRFRQARLERNFDRALAIAYEDGNLAGEELVTLYHSIGGSRLKLALDSVIVAIEVELAETPENWAPYADKGVTLAMQGRLEEAIQLGNKAVAMMPLSRDALAGADALNILGDIYMWSGYQEKAIEIYEQVLSVPCWVNRVDFLIDPYYDPLRDNPGFKKLLGQQSG